MTLGTMCGAGICAARHVLAANAFEARDHSRFANASLKSGFHAKPRLCEALDQQGDRKSVV